MSGELNKIILAGAFACSNMGQRIDDHTWDWAFKYPPTTIRSSMEHFCQQFIETDEHEDIFFEEAKMWERELAKMSDEKIATTWPDMYTAYHEAKERAS